RGVGGSGVPLAMWNALNVIAPHRRLPMNRDNRRLVWELETINDVADGIQQARALPELLDGALQRLVRALAVGGGSIRLRDPVTGAYEVEAIHGPEAVAQLLTDSKAPRPSDRVIAMRTPQVVDDLHDLLQDGDAGPLPIRSALSVPMLAGGGLLGTLTLGAST